MDMKYIIGENKKGGALVLVKVWKGETFEVASAKEDCTVRIPIFIYEKKRDANKALRALQRKLNPGQEQWYNPATDRLISDVGKLHPGDGHTIKVSVKDQGKGAKILVQRSRLLAGNTLNTGSLGRLPPGAARRLSKMLLDAADEAEAVDKPPLDDLENSPD